MSALTGRTKERHHPLVIRSTCTGVFGRHRDSIHRIDKSSSCRTITLVDACLQCAVSESESAATCDMGVKATTTMITYNNNNKSH